MIGASLIVLAVLAYLGGSLVMLASTGGMAIALWLARSGSLRRQFLAVLIGGVGASLAAVREWAGTLAVQVGWNLAPLAHEERAEACLMLIRADDREFPGRSCMMRERYRTRHGTD